MTVSGCLFDPSNQAGEQAATFVRELLQSFVLFTRQVTKIERELELRIDLVYRSACDA